MHPSAEFVVGAAGARVGAMPFEKYRAFKPIDLPDRTWPAATLTRARRVGAASISGTATRRSSIR